MSQLSAISRHGDTEDKVLDPNAKDPDTVYGYSHTTIYDNFIDSIIENKKPFVDGEAG
jgi:UDP-N-acetyl-2-amino-2-deoxyglucuronate dehydrogenase